MKKKYNCYLIPHFLQRKEHAKYMYLHKVLTFQLRNSFLRSIVSCQEY